MLKTKTENLELKKLVTLSQSGKFQNAHYMPADKYNRLVQNLKDDGVLTSSPLVARIQGEGEKLYVASGNHRVQAAIDSGIKQADCIVIQEPVDYERFLAIQLSHNAINGKDDPSALKNLYESLDIQYREYTSISDIDFGVDDLSVVTTGGVSPEYVDVTFSFLTPDKDAIVDFMKTVDKHARKKNPIFVSDYNDFDEFFRTVVDTKLHCNITATAIALKAMMVLAKKQIEAETHEAEQDQDGI